MAQVDVLALIQTLSVTQADGTATPALYSDTIVEMAQQEWFTQSQTWTNTIGQLRVTFLSALATPLIDIGAVIYNDYELDEATLLELEMIDSQWRDARGRTTTFTVEDESAKVIALYPSPDEARTDNVAFFTYAPTDALYYQELFIAMRVLEREFLRESNHQDANFAEGCAILAKMFMSMVG